MNRLTTRLNETIYYNGGRYLPTTLIAEMETEDIRICMKKLAEYEDKENSDIEQLKLEWDMGMTELKNGLKLLQEVKIIELKQENEELRATISKMETTTINEDDLK